MRTIRLNHHFRDHFLLGLVVSFWLVFFLTFIAPFDLIEFDLSEKLYLMPPYGFFFLFSYVSAVFLQEKIYDRLKFWNLWLELGLLIFTILVNLFLTYFYYTLPIINGYLGLFLFIRLVYFPITVLTMSLLVLGRLFISRQTIITQIQPLPTNKITLLGDNKNDALQIEPNKIVCISSAHNYIEIFYQQKNTLHKHLIRSSLKKVAQQVDVLLQVHRSHLINPNYIIKWVDSKTLLVDEKEIPVSKTYRPVVLAHLISVPKTAHLVPKEG
ncbi:MAG: LytTR family DNA-binding domain-containing protein [Bacteroidota bacterium]